MAFTTGLITSPTPAVGWSLGNVATPEWANLVSGNINGWLAGTNSMKGLVLDGTGGLAATPVSGALKLTATASASSAPTSGVTPGVYYKDTAIFSWGYVDTGGNLQLGANVNSTSRSSAGVYPVSFVTSAPSFPYCVVACMVGSTGFIRAPASMTTSGFTINTFNTSGVAADSQFSFIVVVGN